MRRKWLTWVVIVLMVHRLPYTGVMKKSDVLAWLKENRDERGIAHWKKDETAPAGLKSYGIGLVKLRKFAKSVGRDAKLAGQLVHKR